MEAEQSQNFNERLSQWVASQGFWFQVRYSMSGSGVKGNALFQLLSMGFRLLVFLLLIALGTWIYLVKRVDRPSFQEAIRTSLQTGLTASETQMKGFSQIQGQASINRLACQGADTTFFSSLEARNIRWKMGVLDGFRPQWDPETIAISRVDMDLRAGADDAESAHKISEALFRKFPKVQLNGLEVADTTIRWGYSDRTQGSIEGSSLKMLRGDGVMKMTFRGGTFSQNWLRKLDIVNLVVVCDPDGITFEKAEFRRGNATIDLAGLKIVGGERPAVQGIAKIRSLSLESILPPAFRNFVEGTFSGDFQVFGSTNTSDGIGFKGLVTLDGQDVLTLRERIHILKALSIVDFSRNYHRVDFSEGSFRMKTSGGGMELTDVKLKAGELFTLEGAMKVRLPTAEETKAAVDQNARGGAPIFIAEDGETEETEAKNNTADFTLKRAALEAKRSKDINQGEGAGSLFDRLGLSFEMRRLEEQASERLSRMLRYEGNFKISIPQDAFENAPKLSAQYPVDPLTRRIPLMVPIDGGLYEITLKQGEAIYQLREGVTR
ncbi:MAG: hypothetical protein ABIT37_01380 [Luteolibacter sp.]